MVCWFVPSLVERVGCRVEVFPDHLVPDRYPMVHSRHSCSGRCSDGQDCRRYHADLDHSRQEKIQTEDEGRVHLHVAFVGLEVIEGSVEAVVAGREGVAGRDCVADGVEEEMVDGSQTATCLSCTVMSDMGLWQRTMEAVVRLSATIVAATPTAATVVSLAFVAGFATSYCEMGRYICQPSRYSCNP
jgi:hypothetical protein